MSQEHIKKHLTYLGPPYTLLAYSPKNQEKKPHTLITNNINEAITWIINKNTTHNISIAINQMDGKGHKKENVSKIQNLLIDIDAHNNETHQKVNQQTQNIINAIEKAGGQKPNLIINTGHGKHLYYKIQINQTDEAKLKPFLEKLKEKNDLVDTNTSDIARKGRIAGTINHNWPDKPTATIFAEDTIHQEINQIVSNEIKNQKITINKTNKNPHYTTILKLKSPSEAERVSCVEQIRFNKQYDEEQTFSYIEKNNEWTNFDPKKTYDKIKTIYKTYSKNKPKRANNKPEIQLPSWDIGELEFFKKATEQIINANPNLFKRLETQDIVEARKIQIDENTQHTYGFQTLTPERLNDICITQFNPIGKTKQLTRIPLEQLKRLMASDTFMNALPTIEKILPYPIPIIHNNKLQPLTNGYNKELRTYIPDEAPKINPNINIQTAKDTINKLFEEFCFATPQDKTNAIAGLLTPLCRGLYKTWTSRTPLFFYHANRERAGKDYLAGITGIIYEGTATQNPPISTGQKYNDSNEELKKSIIALFIQGRKRIHFGNNKGLINNSVLEDLITAPVYENRLLGKNQSVKFNNDLEISMSGNTGVSFTMDLRKRLIAISLRLKVEDPNARKFTNPYLHEWVRDNRDLVLSSLYALVREWVEAKQPIYENVVFASFPDWARTVGSILMYNNLGNPTLKNIEFEEDITDEDDNDEDIGILFKQAYEEYKNPNTTKAKVSWDKLINVIAENKLFGIEYTDEIDKSATTRIGMILKKRRQNTLNEIKMDYKGKKTRDRVYYFSKVSFGGLDNPA